MKYIRKDQRYGLRSNPSYKKPSAYKSADRDIKYNSLWMHHAIPADSQGDTNACVGFSSANLAESLYRQKQGRWCIKPGMQIDGVSIWRTGREIFFPKEPVEVGGLWLDQGLVAAIQLGVFPKGTEIVEIKDNSFESLSRRLIDMPFLMAQATHSRWDEASTENGYIDPFRGDYNAGHAILGIAMLKQAGRPYLMLQNSWGTDWGWHGFGIMSESHFQKNMMSSCYAVSLPAGWESYDGWKKLLVRR